MNKINVGLPIIYIRLYNTVPMTDFEATIKEMPISDSTATCTCTSDSSVSLREILAWVLVVILAVLFTGLLSVVLLWMFKKRQARDTSTDNSTPKYEMEGNPCYEATAVKQTTDYEAVRGGGAK
jgi:hypothetical protein